MKKLIDSGIIIALITASLYCIGTAEYNGFVSQLFLDPSIIDRDLHQTLYSGFLEAFPLIIYTLMGYAAARFIYAHVILDAILTWISSSRQKMVKLAKIKRFWRGKKRDHPALRLAKEKSNGSIFLAGSAIAFIFILAHFERNGVESGKKLVTLLNSGKEEPSYPMISVSLEGKDMSLRKITCGARNCAGFSKEAQRIFYFPQGTFSHELQKTKSSGK
jgi:hypothetical protein